MDAAPTASPEVLALQATNRELARLAEGLRLSVTSDRDAVYRDEIEPALRAYIEKLQPYLGTDAALTALRAYSAPPLTEAGLLELQERLRRVAAALDEVGTRRPARRPLWRAILALLFGAFAAFWWLAFLSAIFLLQVEPQRGRELASSSTLSFQLFVGLAFALFAVALWRPAPRRLPLPSSRMLGGLGALSLVAAFVLGAVLPGTAVATSIVREGEPVDVAGLATIAAPGGWQMKRDTTGIAPQAEFSRDLMTDRTLPENNETLRADLIVVPASGLRLSHESFFADVIAGAKSAAEGGRLRTTSFASRADTSRGAECLRYDRVQEDRGVPQFLGTVFLLTTHDLVCFHPSGSALVRARWSHRHLGSAVPRVSEDAAEPYLDSLRLHGAARAGSAQPSRALGAILFSDKFSSQAGRWSRFDNDKVFIDYRDGAYEMTERKPWSWAVLVPNNAARGRDVHIEVDLRFTPDDEIHLVGPTCRLVPKDKAAYYSFLISPSGWYGIARAANSSELTWLAASTFWTRPAIGTQSVHHVEADCVGAGDATVLTLRVDGTELLQVQDDSGQSVSDSGLAGLYFQGGQGFSATATSYVVWSLVP